MNRQLRLPKAPTLLSIVACTLLTLIPAPLAVAKRPSPPEPTVIRADHASLILAWEAPSFSTRRIRNDDGHFENVIEAPGWSIGGLSGEPALPTASAVAVVPPSAEIDVEVESSPPRRVQLSLPLKREPVPQVPDGYEQPGEDPSWWQDRLGGRNDVVTVEGLGWMRGHRLVQVSFSPLRYSEERRALEVVDKVRVQLTFSQSTERAMEPRSLTAPARESDGFASLLEDIVINPEQVGDFTGEGEVTSSSADLATNAAGGASYKIAVTEEGIHELTHEALREAGVTLDGAPPEALRLHHADGEVAYQWDGDGDDTFEQGERILFYARPSSSRWAAHDIYWLTSGESGTLMTTRSGDPVGVGQQGALWATAEAEDNTGENNYLPKFRSERDGDHWYWDELWREYGLGTGEYDKTFPISLLEPDPLGPNGTLSLYLQGTSVSEDLDPDHRVAVSLNGEPLGHVTWDGLAYHSAALTAPAGALDLGENELRLTLSRNSSTEGVDKMWLDAFEIRYPVRSLQGHAARLEGEDGRNAYTVSDVGSSVRVYDVSDPLAPASVTEVTTADRSVSFADQDTSTRTYYVLGEDQIRTPEWIEPARELPQPAGAPDYVIISHSDFIPAVTPLAERRAEAGLMVHVVPVEAVYDAFGDGRVDPQTIKDYVAYAYAEWGTEYLLLVGDGTHDPLNNYVSPDHGPTFIPPYLGMFNPYWGEVPSDNRFATVDGSDDRLPDLYVGRLPVNTAAEAEAVVAKILAYEEAPTAGPWNQPLLFFADTKDGGTDFHFHADQVYESIPEPALESYTPQRIYYCEENCTEPYQISDKERMRETVLNKLNWGALMASWTGHSSWHQWGAQRLFHLDDLVNLNNGGALPIFLQMTCFTSYFSQPTSDTLDESLLRLTNGGAIATWGPTSLGMTAAHEKMHKAFVHATLGGEPVELGEATVAARTTLPGIYASLWDTYVLFGDPAMGLNLEVDAWQNTIYLPLVAQNAGGEN